MCVCVCVVLVVLLLCLYVCVHWSFFVGTLVTKKTCWLWKKRKIWGNVFLKQHLKQRLVTCGVHDIKIYETYLTSFSWVALGDPYLGWVKQFPDHPWDERYIYHYIYLLNYHTNQLSDAKWPRAPCSPTNIPKTSNMNQTIPPEKKTTRGFRKETSPPHQWWSYDPRLKQSMKNASFVFEDPGTGLVGFGRVGPKWKNPGTHNTLDWWNRGTRRFWRTLLNHQHHQHLCEPSFTGLPVKKQHGICMHLPPAHQTKTPGNSTRFFASLTICCIFSLS